MRLPSSLLTERPPPLFAEAQSCEDGPIALHVLLVEVCELSPPLSHHHKEAALRVVVVPVRPEVLAELVDILSQEGYLHLWRTGVGLVSGVFLDEALFLLFAQHMPLAWPSSFVLSVSSV